MTPWPALGSQFEKREFMAAAFYRVDCESGRTLGALFVGEIIGQKPCQ